MKKKLFSAIAFALLLTACGGAGPSEKVVREIALAEFEQMAVLAAMFTPESELNQARKAISAIKLKSCVQEKNAPAMFGKDVYLCEIEMGNSSRKGGKESHKVVLAKIDKEWVAPRGILK